MACDGATRQTDIGTIDVHQLAIGGIAGTRDIDEDATDLQRCPRHGSDLIDVVGSRRSAVDPAGHAVLQIVDDTPLQARAYFRDLALGVYLSGRHRIRRQIGNSVVEGWSDPGTINLTHRVLRGLGKQARPRAPRSW